MPPTVAHRFRTGIETKKFEIKLIDNRTPLYEMLGSRLSICRTLRSQLDGTSSLNYAERLGVELKNGLIVFYKSKEKRMLSYYDIHCAVMDAGQEILENIGKNYIEKIVCHRMTISSRPKR